MRVLINALGAGMGGAQRHLSNFLPELGAADTSNEYVVLVRESAPAMAVRDNIQVERYGSTRCSSSTRRLIADCIGIPNRVRRDRVDTVVSLTNFGPVWSQAPHVLFQRNPVYFSGLYLARITARARLDVLLRRKLAALLMRKATMVVTPTRAMATMIQQTVPVEPSKFRTLYHGFSPHTMDAPLEDKFARRIGPDIRLLFPSHPGPHKGYDVLFRIVSALTRRGVNCKVYLTCELGDWPGEVSGYFKDVQNLKISDKVVFLGRVPQAQMGALYRACDLMIYPSLCESFGFSMVEAMGFGLPIVASDTQVNREICSDAALYYPQLDADAGATQVMQALQPGQPERLKRQGFTRAYGYDWSWRRYAREFVGILNSVNA